MAKKTKKTKKAKEKGARKGRKASGTHVLLVGTAKGGFLLEGDRSRRKWKLKGPYLFGQRVHDFRADPRDGKTLLLCATGGHLGPTIYRSTNGGRKWTESERPPRFGTLPEGGQPGRETGTRGMAVKIDFFLEPGHAEDAQAWYCGTSPAGLFRSGDGGKTWDGVAGFNEAPTWWDWTGGGQFASPEGLLLHSIQVDPRDRAHMYVSLSAGGTFETLDGGTRWKPLNRNVAAPMPLENPEYGHDPHCMIVHPGDPDRLYQQNHCGIYRLDRGGSDEWARIGDNMPKAIGDIGFPVVPHPTDPDTVWVFPMDGTQLWPRTSPDAKPAVYRTKDGGKRWKRLDKGLPRKDAWFTVFRQAMSADANPRDTGLYFGTTSGTLWGSRDGGESWSVIAEHLPRILSVRTAELR